MWKWIGIPAASATSHSGFQWGLPSTGSPYRCGSPVKRTPRAPLSTHRSTSRTVASMSQNGVATTGSSRCRSDDAHSSRKSLYAVTHSSLSSSSSRLRKFWLPKPPTFGYSTCAQMPAASM